MRLPAAIGFLGLSALFSEAQNSAVPLAFSGNGATETTVFSVQARWQVTYRGGPASVTVEDAAGLPVSGIGTVGPATLYLPGAGSYKVYVVPNFPGGMHWDLQVTQVGPAGGAVPGGMAVYVPPDMAGPNSGAPVAGATTITGGPVPGQTAPAALPSPVTPTGAAAAPATPPPMTPATAAAQPHLTDAQTAAMVLIHGDNAEGTGFLVKTTAGSFIITNQHVIGNNPHIKFTTTSGDEVKILGLQGAQDRDLAMIPVQDNHYQYLEMAADIGNSVQVGDQVLTPGNSEGGGVMLASSGTILALGPQKIEFSNAIYHGNSGGPILHVKTGKVIGVVTEGMKVDTSNSLDQASYSSGQSGIKSEMRYFGMRLDNVPAWQDCNWNRFENETTFLDQFHERSKCLDSYLNTGMTDTSEWGTYFARDDKVKGANDQLAQQLNGADSSQRLDAVRNLVFNLDAVADADMDQIQVPANFYPFDQERAKEEIAYRVALKSEIANMGNDISRVSGLARRGD